MRAEEFDERFDQGEDVTLALDLAAVRRPLQVWRITDAEALTQLDMPEHETAVEIPAELLRYAPRPTA